MISIEKLVAGWYLARSSVAEIRKKYPRALALQDCAGTRVNQLPFFLARKIGLLISNEQTADIWPLLSELAKAPRPSIRPTNMSACARRCGLPS